MTSPSLKTLSYFIVMSAEDKDKKLVELASKATSVNKELLRQEKEFIKAVNEGKEITMLEKINENIKLLIRKENLFLGALQRLLQKMKGQ
jgi:hypothetical protein